MYSRSVQKAPKRLVTNGKFTFGTYTTPFEIINPLDAIKPLPLRVPEFLKNMRLKEWQAFQMGNKDFFILAAVYNAKGLGVVQFVVIDQKRGRKHLFQRYVPFWKMKVARSLMDSVTCCAGKNFSFHIHNNLKNDRIFFNFWTRGKKGLHMSCRVEAFHTQEACTPIVICQPFGENRALYSHKAMMPLSGRLCLGDDVSEFAKNDSFMIMDDHKGYYPYIMTYDWVTTAGHDRKNRFVGFNLTDNQVKDHEQYNENCLWVDGRMVPLPPDQGPTGKMHRDGTVNLKFSPKFDGRIELDFKVFETKYYAPYGHFEGYIAPSHENKIIFDGFFGMGEKKYIKA